MSNTITTFNGNVGIGTQTPVSTLDISGIARITGDVSLNSRLSIGGDVSLNNRLFVVGDVSINGNLRAQYPVNSIPTSAIIGLNNSSNFASDISGGMRLFVLGDASLNSRLFVESTITAANGLTVNAGSTSLQGGATIASGLTVSGVTSLQNGLTVASDSSFNRVYIGGSSIHAGDSLFNQRLSVAGDVSMNSNLQVNGSSILSNVKLSASTPVNLTLGDSFVTNTGSITLSANGSGSTVTLPQTGTLSTLAGTETLTNKTLTAPTLTTPTLGAASATSVNKVAFTAPATGATLALADGSTLATAGANFLTLTSTDATNVTLPTAGTLATLAGTETLTNKTLGAVGQNTNVLGNLVLDPATNVTSAGSITLAPYNGNGNGNVHITGDLIVDGSTNILGKITQTNVLISVSEELDISASFANPVLRAFQYGSGDIAQFSLGATKGNTAVIGQNGLAVGLGVISASYPLDVSGFSRFNGDVSLNQRVFVNGDASLNSRLYVASMITSAGGLTVSSGTTSLQATTLEGAVTNTGGISGSGAIATSGGLTVSSGTTSLQATTLAGAVTNTGGISGSGAIATSGGLTVSAGTTSLQATTVSGVLTNAGGISGSGAIATSGGLTVSSGATSLQATTLAGIVTNTGGISGTGAIATSGGLTVSSGTTSVQGITVAGTLTNSGGIAGTGAIATSGGLTVSAGTTSLQATTVSGVLTNAGGISGTGAIATSGGLSVSAGATSLYGGINIVTTYNNLAISANTQSTLQNATGTWNIGIGTNALSSTPTGSYNVGIGYSALQSNTSGSQNVGIGQYALQNTISGNQNVGIGQYALQYNVTGTNNTVLGYNAGPANGGTAYSYSTAIGYNATISASNQIVLGTAAETTVVPGDVSLNNRFFVGKDASFNSRLYMGGAVTNVGGISGTGAIATSGGLTVSAGTTSLQATTLAGAVTNTGGISGTGAIATSGGLTVSSGATSLQATTVTGALTNSGGISGTGAIATSGGLTVSSGTTSVQGITVAGSLTNTGGIFGAGSIATSGGLTVSAGTTSLQATTVSGVLTNAGGISGTGAIATSGGLNVSAGATSLYGGINIVTPYANLAISANTQSTLQNATGTWNIGIGTNALSSTPSGSHNIGIGTSALQNNTSGNRNIGIGQYALQYNATGSNNTALGYNAGPASSGIAYNYSTAIGYNATFDASNQIVLGTAAETTVVPGDVSLNNQLFVGKDASFNSRVYMGGAVTNTGGISGTGAIATSGGLIVSAGTTSLQATTLAGAVTNTGGISGTGAIATSGGLTVSAGVTSIQGLTSASDSSFNSHLYVGGDVSMNGNVQVNGSSILSNVKLSASTPVNLTLGNSFVTNTGSITLSANGSGSIVTLPQTGTLATLAGTEALTNKTLGAVGQSTNVLGNLVLDPATNVTSTSSITLAPYNGNGNGNVRITGDLIVDGSTNILGKITQTNVLISVSEELDISASFANPVMRAFQYGSGDIAQFSLGETMGNTAVIGQNGLAVGLGVISASYPLDVSGFSRFNGDVSLNQRVFVNGDASLNSRLYVASMITSAGGLTVSSGTTSLQATTLAGAVTNTGGISGSGAIATSGGLTVSAGTTSLQATTLAGAVTNSGGISGTGAIATSGGLTVTSSLTSVQGLAASSDSSFNSRLYIGGSSTLGGDSSLNQRLFVGSDASFGARVYIASDLSVNGTLLIGANTIPLNSIIALNTASAFTTDLTTGSRLFVTGDASLNSRLYVASGITNAGGISGSGAVATSGGLTVSAGTTSLQATTVAGALTNSGGISGTGAIATSGGLTVSAGTTSLQATTLAGAVTNSGGISGTGAIATSGGLTVSAGTTSLQATTLAGAVTNSGGISGTGAIATSGGLTVSAGTTSLQATTLAGAVTNSGGISGTGAIATSGGLTVSAGTASVQGLVASSDSSFNNRLYIGGSTIHGGDSSFNQRLFVGSDASFGGRVYIASGITTPGGLTVSAGTTSLQATTLAGAVTNTGGISGTGAIATSGGLTVSAGTTILQATTLAGAVTNSVGISGSGAIATSGGLTVSSGTTILQATTLTGAVTNTGGISGSGAIATSGGLTVSAGSTSLQTTTVASGLTVSSGVTSIQALTSASDSSFNSRLYVGGDVSMNGNVQVNGSSILSNVRLSASAPVNLTLGNSFVTNTGSITLSANGAGSTVTLPQTGTLSTLAGTETLTNKTLTAPTLTTPSLGVASAASVNKVAFTAPATGATLALADGSTLATAGANSLTLASTGATNVTLPTTGTLATLAGTETLTNKTLSGPIFTGIPTAPTATAGTNTTQLATTAYVRGEVSALVASAPAALDTLNELALALGSDASFSTTVNTAIGLRANIANPTFTGVPAAPTAAVGTNTTQLATTAFVATSYAPLSNPTFTSDVSMNSRLYVASMITGAAGFTVSAGTTSLQGVLSAADSSFNNRLYIGGSSILVGDSSFNTRVSIGGDVSMNGALQVKSNIYSNGNLVLTTASNLAGTYASLSGPTFTGDVSMNSRLAVSSDVSLNTRVSIGGDVSMNGLLQVRHAIVLGSKTANPSGNNTLWINSTDSNKLYLGGNAVSSSNSTATTTTDSWVLTNIINPPPAIVPKSVPVSTSTSIYIAWTYPTQMNIGLLASYTPLINSITAKYSINNGSRVTGNMLAGNTAQSGSSSGYIRKNLTDLSNGNAGYVSGIVLVKTTSGTIGTTSYSLSSNFTGTGATGYAGLYDIYFPQDNSGSTTSGVKRKALVYYDSTVEGMTTEPVDSSNNISVYYQNNNTGFNDVSLNFNIFVTAGFPSILSAPVTYPTNGSLAAPTYNTLDISYAAPLYGDNTNQTTATPISSYQIKYTPTANNTRIVPYTYTNFVGVDTQTGTVFRDICNNLLPDTSYNVQVAAKNTVNTSYNTFSNNLLTGTAPMQPILSNITGYGNSSGSNTNSFGTSYTAKFVGGTTSTMYPVFPAGTITSPVFSIPINELATRGNLGVGNTVDLSAGILVSGALKITGPTIRFPNWTSGNITAPSIVSINTQFGTNYANNNITFGSFTIVDASSGTGTGYYLHGNANVVVALQATDASSSLYNLTLYRKGATTMTGSYSFYADVSLNITPSISDTSINSISTTLNSSYNLVSGVNVVYGSPTLAVTTSGINNIGHYFYNSSQVVTYSISGSHGGNTTTTETSLANGSFTTTGNAISSAVKITNSSVNVTAFTSFANGINLSTTVYNVAGGNAVGNNLATFPVIIDPLSITLVYSTLAQSVPTVTSSAVVGYRVYGGTSTTTTNSSPNAIYYTGTNTYLSLPYNNYWDISSGIQYANKPTNTGTTIDVSVELQVANGLFQSKTSATNAYLNYSTYYYGASQNTVNYSGISTSGYRYANFAWKIGSVAVSGITFTINGTPTTYASTSSIFVDSGKTVPLQMYYRFEAPASPTPSASNFSSYWINANALTASNGTNSSNYYNNAFNANGLGSFTVYSNNLVLNVAVPNTLSSANTAANYFTLYFRIGLPMSNAYSFTTVTAVLT